MVTKVFRGVNQERRLPAGRCGGSLPPRAGSPRTGRLAGGAPNNKPADQLYAPSIV